LKTEGRRNDSTVILIISPLVQFVESLLIAGLEASRKLPMYHALVRYSTEAKETKLQPAKMGRVLSQNVNGGRKLRICGG
jgi:hypothetical protein